LIFLLLPLQPFEINLNSIFDFARKQQSIDYFCFNDAKRERGRERKKGRNSLRKEGVFHRSGNKYECDIISLMAYHAE
jgi:hypothetical protein